MRPKTTMEHARQDGVPATAGYEAGLLVLFHFQDFQHFIDISIAVYGAVAHLRTRSELGEDVAQSVYYLEIHLKPGIECGQAGTRLSSHACWSEQWPVRSAGTLRRGNAVHRAWCP